MKKLHIVLLAVAVIAVAGYFAVGIATEKTNEGQGERSTFSSSELGVEFDYRAGPTGYVLEEATPADAKTGLVRTLTLFRAEDKLEEMPVGGEGPPVIAIYVFNNLEKQRPQTWADTHVQYSNINLKSGDILETSVGGANAIRYMADGLYASENVVVTHGDSAYVITGQFMDGDSDIRRDFQPLLGSVRFIQKPGQI